MGVDKSRRFAAQDAADVKLYVTDVKLYVGSSVYHSTTTAIQNILLWQAGHTTANVGENPGSQQSALHQRQHTSSFNSPALS